MVHDCTVIFNMLNQINPSLRATDSGFGHFMLLLFSIPKITRPEQSTPLIHSIILVLMCVLYIFLLSFANTSKTDIVVSFFLQKPAE